MSVKYRSFLVLPDGQAYQVMGHVAHLMRVAAAAAALLVGKDPHHLQNLDFLALFVGPPVITRRECGFAGGELGGSLRENVPGERGLGDFDVEDTRRGQRMEKHLR